MEKKSSGLVKCCAHFEGFLALQKSTLSNMETEGPINSMTHFGDNFIVLSSESVWIISEAPELVNFSSTDQGTEFLLRPHTPLNKKTRGIEMAMQEYLCTFYPMPFLS